MATDRLTGEQIAELRAGLHQIVPGSGGDWYVNDTAETLRELAPALIAAAEENARLRAENERLKKLLDDACNDEEELHARIDAILGKEVIDPPGTGRTPLTGDDGRLAALLTALREDELLRLRAEVERLKKDSVVPEQEVT